MERRSDFFQAGGTLDRDAPSYIERPADEKLLAALDKGELCMVLAPRQTGKSSLMIHALGKLEAINICPGIVDFQSLGGHQVQEKWFSDVVYQLERSLGLETDTLEWWEDHARLGATQRFMVFLEDVVLKEVDGRVVIFFDEIDSVLPLPFSDDFFTTIRALYNARASNPVLKRLNFVLLGVATPSEFIRNRARTPFNVGKRIGLTDFDPASLSPFREVLGLGSEPVAERIFYWTSGQPFMVQKLAEKIYACPEEERTPKQLDDAVCQSYLDVQIEKDTHLQFIQDYLTNNGGKGVRKTLKTYQTVLAGKAVPYNEQSPVHSRLLLSGVVKVQDDVLVSRNRIYQKVFNREWIRENIPSDVTKMVAFGASAALVLVLLWFFLVQQFFIPEFPEKNSAGPFYTDQTTLELNASLSDDQARRVTVDGQDVYFERGADPKKSDSIVISLNNLEVGQKRHSVCFYNEMWQDNSFGALSERIAAWAADKNFNEGNTEYECLVVHYPQSDWKLPTDLEMVKMPEGCFDMGCGDWTDNCDDDEKPVHRVCLSVFKMGKYEVTQKQWEQVMGYNPSRFKNGGKYPVENVSWKDIQEFVRRLDTLTGRQYRLPTEAEWEYAARSGGKPEKYAGGNNLDELGWYDNNSNNQTHPVGKKKPNGLGIYDMSGNVWEWCQDWYDKYPADAVTDPVGPDTGSYRVVRGGSWLNYAGNCRSASRSNNSPGNRHGGLGFRLVCFPGQQGE